jgi:ABC-type phosphate transport system auxiliary subunit
LSARREKGQRRYAFRERQLQDFYSPLLGLRMEIRARSDLRVQVRALAGSVWETLVAEARQSPDPEAMLKLERHRWPLFEKVAIYDDKKLPEELIPTYRKMLSIFRDNLWLAEPETRRFFKTLLEFVDIWERWIGGNLVPEILSGLDHSESKLQPFYDHLERKHDELRARLSGGSV